MSIKVKLPQYGMGMSEGTIVAWLKQVGEVVAAGEPLAEIEAAKTTVELVSPAAGTLTAHLVPEGETVPVYTAIAVLN